MEMTITLPWPSKALQPNARVHWAAKAKATKQARYEAELVATAVMRLVGWTKCERASIEYVFYDPVKRRRDRDNHLAACKAYNDGLADAGIVGNDSGFTFLPVRFEIGQRRVEARVTA